MLPVHKHDSFRRSPVVCGLLWLAGILLAGALGLYLVVSLFPSVGAHSADTLRALIGDQAVAQLETRIFQVQDDIRQIEYRLGWVKAASPWQAQNPAPVVAVVLSRTSPTPSLTPAPSRTPAPQSLLAPNATPSPTIAPTAIPTTTPWQPPAAHALGKLKGEAVWQPYMKDTQGQVVAYRTFIQPDPQRPYVAVAVVAFDLTRTRLNFKLGYDEPSLKGGPKGNGLIPPADLQPGVLLATFNGGFKAEHGLYGAMSDGIVALKPIQGMATIVIHPDGSIQMGEYGKDITSLDGAVAWRQNCSLIIQDGKINPLVYNDSAKYWGARLNGDTATWRSGIGISPDGKTLYYFAGPSLRMPVLADAMQAVGVETAMQLDINNYWVHFDAIQFTGSTPVPEPLFPNDMKADAGRYLVKYPRDFFFVTSRANPTP